MKKILLPGIIAAVVATLLSMLVSYPFQLAFPWLEEAYKNTALFRPMDNPLWSLFFVEPLFLYIVLAWLWDKTKGVIEGSFLKRAFCFGFAIWLIATIPGMILTYSGFQMTLTMVVNWTTSALVSHISAGMVYAKMNP